MSLSDGGREQVLLEAQFLNGLAVSLFGTGVLGNIAAFIFVNDPTGDKAYLAAFFGLLCFSGCFGLHTWARLRLRELDR